MQKPVLFLALFGLLVIQAIMPFAIDFIASIAIAGIGFMIGRSWSEITKS